MMAYLFIQCTQPNGSWCRSLALSLFCGSVILCLSRDASAQPPNNPPTLVKEFRLLADNIKLPLAAVALSKDGKFALSMSKGPAVLGLGVQFWNVEAGKAGVKLDIKGNVEGLAISTGLSGEAKCPPTARTPIASAAIATAAPAATRA